MTTVHADRADARPLDEAALEDLQVVPGTRLLDLGSGNGPFLRLAAGRGAHVTTTPELGSLPWPARSFDAVCAFFTVELAADPPQVLAEAGRVARAGAPVLIATWGRRGQCEAAACAQAVGGLAGIDPFTLARFGALRAAMLRARLAPAARRDVPCAWSFPDAESLLQRLLATPLAARAIDIAGERSVAVAILRAAAPYRTHDGGYRLENTFTYLIARIREEHIAMTTIDERQQTERKGFDTPDEVREFPNGRAEILHIGGGEVGRLVFQPGWRWSNDVKPIAGTDSCQAPHFQYHVSGRLAVRMDDGTEFVAEPGDITSLPSGHDGWVVGDEPAVVIDWYGASTYAKPS